MSDIKKTALIILIIALLSNTFTQYAYAANDIDHDAMLEYEGYGKAMYETIVEQSTYLTGQYADNKDYVNEAINEIKDYANFWSNERQNLEQVCGGFDLLTMNCLGEMVETGGGYLLTVGDWFKNLFNDYEENINPSQEYPQHALASYFVPDGDGISVIEGYEFSVGSRSRGNRLYIGISTSTIGGKRFILSVSLQGAGLSQTIYSEEYNSDEERKAAIDQHKSKASSVNYMLGLASQYGEINLYQSGKLVVVDGGVIPPRQVNPITKYITENGSPQIPVPQLKPQLVCPNGAKIDMNISGSTFLAVDGTVMMVNKDGTAEVNGEICNLNWQKPTTHYNPDGQVVTTNPDGTKTNLDTGDTTTKPPAATDLEGCTGVLCGIGKLLDGLGSVVGAIGDLIADLLDGLLKLFVPEDLDFMSDEFSRITKKLNEKIAITDSLKAALTSIFNGADGGNPLANISLNLPITNEPLTFGNVSFIEEGVPILRKVISAIAVLYTITYVYRKITGRGGVMER